MQCNKDPYKKKGRKSKVEIYQAKEMIQSMVDILSKQQDAKEYNFNMIISNIQQFQKLIQIFSHISQDIYVRVNKIKQDGKKTFVTMLLYQDEGITMKIQLNESFFEGFSVKHNKDFVIQHENLSQFIKQKNSYQLLQINNKITNNVLQQNYVNTNLDLKLIYQLEPSYAGSQTSIEFQEGKTPIQIPVALKNFNRELHEYANMEERSEDEETHIMNHGKIDLLVALITNLYQNSNENDIFVFKIFRNYITFEQKTQVQQRIEISLQKQQANKVISVQGDELLQNTGNNKNYNIRLEKYGIKLKHQQIQQILQIYNQYQRIAVFYKLQYNEIREMDSESVDEDIGTQNFSQNGNLYEEENNPFYRNNDTNDHQREQLLKRDNETTLNEIILYQQQIHEGQVIFQIETQLNNTEQSQQDNIY